MSRCFQSVRGPRIRYSFRYSIQNEYPDHEKKRDRRRTAMHYPIIDGSDHEVFNLRLAMNTSVREPINIVISATN